MADLSTTRNSTRVRRPLTRPEAGEQNRSVAHWPFGGMDSIMYVTAHKEQGDAELVGQGFNSILIASMIVLAYMP